MNEALGLDSGVCLVRFFRKRNMRKVCLLLLEQRPRLIIHSIIHSFIHSFINVYVQGKARQVKARLAHSYR